MSVRILHDTAEHAACLYCSTSGWAFGPVFDDTDDQDAGDRCQAFLEWHQDTYGEIRSAPQHTLEQRHTTWARQQELRKEILEAEL